MKVRVLPLAIISLLLLIVGVGCNDDRSDYDIVAKGTLIFTPTGTTGFCIVKTHTLKTNEGDIDLFIDSRIIDPSQYENNDVTIYGCLSKQRHKRQGELCPDVIEVKKIYKN